MYNLLPIAAGASLLIIFSSTFLSSNPNDDQSEKVWPNENYMENYQVVNFAENNSQEIFKTDGQPKIKAEFVNLRYPGSTILSYNDRQMEMESLDDVSEITNWYISKLTELKMNVKNIIKTDTNGKILNSLVGSNEKKDWSFQITKEENLPIVKILINEN